MEKNLDERMSEIAARIEETRRIRRGLYAHLGERVFNQVVADPDLRNGKEEILGAIAACNRELGRLEDASASLDARMFAASQVGGPALTHAVSPEATAGAEPACEPVAAAEAAGEPVHEEPVRADADAPVVVTPLEPLAPAAAPEPVTLEPMAFDAVPVVDAEAMPEATIETAEIADTDAPTPVDEAAAAVVADDGGFVDGAAPTIVLDRGGEAHEGSAPEAAREAVDANDARTCPVCGAPVAADHRFCMNCGYRLDN